MHCLRLQSSKSLRRAVKRLNEELLQRRPGVIQLLQLKPAEDSYGHHTHFLAFNVQDALEHSYRTSEAISKQGEQILAKMLLINAAKKAGYYTNCLL